MRSVIIDNDADFDDLITIAWLNALPNIDIKAITYVGTGWTTPEDGLNNLLRFCEAIGMDKNIPIAKGATKILSPGKCAVPPALLKYGDRLWDVQLSQTTRKASELTAVDLIIKTCMESKNPVTIIAIGPSTNIALALQKEPKIKKNIEGIYITDGVPLEVFLDFHEATPPDHSAGNERSDIVAYKIVCENHIPTYALVPTAALGASITDNKILNGLKGKSRQGALIFDLLNQVVKIQGNTPGYNRVYMWDVVTAYCFLYNKFEATLRHISINTSAPKGVDPIKESPDGFPHYEIDSVDTDDFLKHFLKEVIKN